MLVVGLGNPTAKYEKTRHNAGFWFLDRLAQNCQVNFRDEPKFLGAMARYEGLGAPVFFLKPTTYMNRSGQSVQAVARYYKIEPNEILVVHDELDLMPGHVRLKKGGGHGGHNGLRDLIAVLGTSDFLRLRLGIGHPGDRSEVASYVLDEPSKVDTRLVDDAIDRALQESRAIMQGEVASVMGRLNANPGKE